MRPKPELALALGLLIMLGVLLIATRDKSEEGRQVDVRRSTYLAGPDGARGLADALLRMNHPVQRFRRRPSLLSTLPTNSTLLAVLDPVYDVDPLEARQVAAYGREGGDLLLAGKGTDAAMACYGFTTDQRKGDSVQVAPPGERPGRRAAWTADVVLAAVSDSGRRDSTTSERTLRCNGPKIVGADTLLVTPGGRVAALRLHTKHNFVILVADGSLFSNRKMRGSDAGVFALGTTADYERVVFDEYHQGFGSGGSLWGEVIAWSRDSPWGWAIWQLVAVGIIALLAGTIRFGATIPVFERKRRSPIEHLRALATALAAARGTDVAVELMVKGLRRRLSSAGQPNRGNVRDWLTSLADNVRTERSRVAVRTLLALTRRAPDADNVLQAANAVEDVWQDLSLSRPTK
jgi:hypothetical protein